MNNFIGTKKSALFLLLVCVLIIAVSIFMQSASSKKAINEVVTFNDMISNKSTPFEVKSSKKLYLNVYSEIESGDFSIRIISPNNEIVYEKIEKNIDEQTEINVYKGVWRWEVKCNGENDETSGAKNGSYSIVGELK